MNRTWFLAAVAVAVLALEVFPAQSGTLKWLIIALGAAYLLGRGLTIYPRWYREKRARRAQTISDEQEYRRYRDELDAIRARYEPLREFDAVPAALQTEVDSLHDRYQGMLSRKFGPLPGAAPR